MITFLHVAGVKWKGEPMSWGIAETAPEIEKIKSESADYLNGLNSCGVIDWSTYNYAFDFYADLLMKAYEQGGKDAQPERKTGHWKLDWKNGKATCSKCGHTFKDAFDIDNFDNFCRHCGARMEVDVE